MVNNKLRHDIAVFNHETMLMAWFFMISICIKNCKTFKKLAVSGHARYYSKACIPRKININPPKISKNFDGSLI